MTIVVADTSALVSLGTVIDHELSPMNSLLDTHDIIVPQRVVDELRETASYTDVSGEAAQAVLDRLSEFDRRTTDLDEGFPLDDGENAAVTLANDIGATQLLCDEFNQLALIHASLADVRLVTTSVLLSTLVHNGILPAEGAQDLLTEISDARSWMNNTYVTRVKATLHQEMSNSDSDTTVEETTQ